MACRNRWFTWVYLLKMGGFSMANCECHNQMDPMSLDTTPSTFRNLRAFVAHPFSSLVDSMPMKHYYCTGLHENVGLSVKINGMRRRFQLLMRNVARCSWTNLPQPRLLRRCNICGDIPIYTPKSKSSSSYEFTWSSKKKRPDKKHPAGFIRGCSGREP